MSTEANDMVEEDDLSQSNSSTISEDPQKPSWNEQVEALPPAAGIATKIAQTAPVRDLICREKNWQLKLETWPNHSAALAQRRGQMASIPCKRCLYLRGPFKGCVVRAGLFSGACCNCYYKNCGHNCSFRKDQSGNTTKSSAPLIVGKKIPKVPTPTSTGPSYFPTPDSSVVYFQIRPPLALDVSGR